MADKIKDYAIITAGTLLLSAGIYFFKFPNNFSTGGVSGASVILHALLPTVSAGTFVLIFNSVLLIIGFLVFGRDFGIRTVYCSMLMSVSLFIAEKTIPLNAPLTSQPFLELIYSVMLPAIGSAILFNTKASSGGTDIVAMIMRKYTHIEIGKALFCSDFLVTIASMLVFNIQTGMFSLLGLLMKALVVDSVIENFNLSKNMVIITDKPEQICIFIRDVLDRSATLLSGEGAFSHKNKKVIITVLNRGQAIKLRSFIKQVDPAAFIIISNTSEIVGKGFREILS